MRVCLEPLGIPNQHTRLRVSDRHARLEISMRCHAHELNSILIRRPNSQYVCMYVCLEPPEVPPLTNLKKLNYRSNTERFS